METGPHGPEGHQKGFKEEVMVETTLKDVWAAAFQGQGREGIMEGVTGGEVAARGQWGASAGSAPGLGTCVGRTRGGLGHVWVARPFRQVVGP